MDYEPIQGTIVTDEKWFEFIINQVLSNALKYTMTGSIKIKRDDNSILIRDTGIGISEEDLPRVFDKGYTGFNGRMDKKATGIGLYLSKRVAEKLGMTILVQSKIGVGTVVCLKWDNKLTKM